MNRKIKAQKQILEERSSDISDGCLVEEIKQKEKKIIGLKKSEQMNEDVYMVEYLFDIKNYTEE